jgi:hypothetical protein
MDRDRAPPNPKSENKIRRLRRLDETRGHTRITHGLKTFPHRISDLLLAGQLNESVESE